MIKGGTRELEVLGKSEFLRMRNTISTVDGDLTELEYYCLTKIKDGYSVSYLARNVFNVHVTTLQKALTSVNFTVKLNEANSAIEVLTYDMCMKKLTDIILHSTNDSVTIQAIKTLCQLMPQISYAELESVIRENSLTEEEARDVLSKFHIEEEDSDDHKQAR